MQNKKQSFGGRLFAALFSILKQIFTKEVILNFLKTKLIKLALKKLALVAGWQAWLVSLVCEELFERVLQPAIERGIREGKLKVRVHRGKVKIEALVEAKGEGNEEVWNTIADDI